MIKSCYNINMQRRHTKNKKLILDVFNGKHTLTVQEICQLLPDIEVSTVYRNVERFVADGILRELYVHPNMTAYEYTKNIHDHFVCDDCHAVNEIHIRSNSIKKALPSGVIMQDGGIVIHGICKDCIKN